MAHYAFLNSNNEVTEVITGIDETQTIEGLDTETWYGNFRGQTCKRTSYNAATNGFRGNYAGLGMTYLPLKDIFMPPKCHAEAVLNAKSAQWDCENSDHDFKTLA
jgi:hypothetical protein